MNKPQLILIGAGGHTHSCIDVIEHQGQYQIVGLIGTPDEIDKCHFGYSVFKSDDSLPLLAKKYQYALITVGQIRSPDSRINLFERIVELGFKLPIVIAPSAHVSRHATIGEGTIVMHGAIVNAGAEIGRNCIINTRAVVEHDASVSDHCHISTGAIVNGEASICTGTFIGSESVIKEGVTIGQRSVVGMGLAVRHSQPDYTIFVGYEKHDKSNSHHS